MYDHPLDTWLDKNDHTREWLAGKVGSTAASVSRIINGKQWASREFFARLSNITNGEVTADDFTDAPRPSPRPARAVAAS